MRNSLALFIFAAFFAAGCARVSTQGAGSSAELSGNGVLFANSSAPSGATQPPAGTSGRNPAVTAILANRCDACHGAGSAAAGGIDYITNLDLLVSKGQVVPGNPAASPVYVMACGTGPCKSPAIPSGELQTISDWISGL
jgi:hypothetical protein